jgi:hypothetical protein
MLIPGAKHSNRSGRPSGRGQVGGAGLVRRPSALPSIAGIFLHCRELALWAKRRVRRETGKEQRVQVPYDEGLAIRIGPAPCAVAREGIGEASARVCAGQPLSRESGLFSGADAVLLAEGNTEGRISASAPMTRRGRRTWHAQKLLVREPGDLTVDRSAAAAGPHREGEEP